MQQQLPTVENIEGFLASHQIGVAQLAIEYCNALVDDAALRASFFPGFNFATPAAQAFDTAGERALVIEPLVAPRGRHRHRDPADVGGDHGRSWMR